MKKLLAILCLLFPLLSRAATTQIITAQITITNRAVTGSSFTVNGKTVIASNIQSSLFFATNLATIPSTKTQLVAQMSAFPSQWPGVAFADGNTNNSGSATNFRLVSSIGGALSVVVTGAWANVTLSTQGGASTWTALYPLENIVGTTNRTNEGSSMVYGLSTFSTNAFATNSTALSNHLTLGAAPLQKVSSPVQFAAIRIEFGGITNVHLIGVSNLSGFIRHLTNGTLWNAALDSPVTTNLVNYGNAISSPGANALDEQFGTGATATGGGSTAVGNSATASGAESFAGGTQATSSGENSVALGASSTASALNSGALGGSSTSTAEGSFAIGQSATVTGTNTTVIGNNVSTTLSNQVRLGSATQRTHVTQNLQVEGVQTNTTFAGTNVARGSWSYPRFDLTTLAGGANNISVPFGTNRYIRLSGLASGSSAPTIAGIIGGATTGGLDGQDVEVFIDTGFGATFAASTADPVPANRIAGSDYTAADQGTVFLTYDGTDSRWHIKGAFPLTASATNAVTSLSSNGTFYSAITNINILDGTNVVTRWTNASGNLTIQVNAGGGGSGSGLVTNANQFGASVTLSIKDGALVTNITAYGTLTNSGSGDVAGAFRTWAAVTNAGFSYFTMWNGSRALISGSDQSLSESLTTDSEVSYLSGVTSMIQAQLNAKVDEKDGVATNTTIQGATINTNLTLSHLTATRIAILNSSKQLTNGPSGTGVLTNDGSGTIGWMAVPAGGNFSTNTDGSGNFTGSGVGAVKLYDNGQAEFFGIEAPFDVQTNNVLRGLSNGVAGVLVTTNAGTGTNQMFAVPHSAGMFTNNGTGIFGWLAIPSGGGAGVTTNANQFGVTADGQLSLKDGLLATNLQATAIGIGIAADSGIGLKILNSGMILSNSATPKYLRYTNGELTIATTNQPGFSNYIAGFPLVLTNSFEPPTNTSQSAFMRFAVSSFQTGTGATNSGQFAEFGFIPTINAVGTTNGTWVWQSRPTINGVPTTNTTLTSAGVITAAGTAAFANGSYGASATVVSTGGYFWGSGKGDIESPVNGLYDFMNAARTDGYGVRFGGATGTNSLIQAVSSSTGNSNSTLNFVTGNTNGHLWTTHQGVGTYATNWTADTTSFVGYTNTTTYNQIWNIRGTSGNIVFWNRKGATGGSMNTNLTAGVAIWTNTIVANGSDIVVGVDCGIAIDTGVSVTGGGRAF